MAYCVYILASQRNGTLYTGYTDDLHRRMTEHRAHALGRFTAKCGVTQMVDHAVTKNAWVPAFAGRSGGWESVRVHLIVSKL